MEQFALGITIGAVVSGTYNSVITSSGNKIQELTDRVTSLNKQKIAVGEVKKYQAALVELGAKQRTLISKSRGARQELDAAKLKFQQASAAAQKMGIDVSKLADEERRLNAAVKRTNTNLGARTKIEANKKARQELRSNMVEQVASVYLAVKPIVEAVKFESVMADVGKVVDFDSPQGFKAMGQDILKLSTQIPAVATGLADIVAAAGQSGIAKSRPELKAFATDAAKMGVAFDISAGSAGSMMANWRAGMKLNQAETVNLADAVNHLSNNMNAKAGAIGEVLERQGAVAKSAGLTEIQTASLSAALLSSGAPTEIAATALKNLTGALTRGSAATRTQRAAFNELGLDAEQMAVAMQQDAEGAIKSVFEALARAPKEKQSALLTQLFGEESKGAIAPLLTNLANLDQAFEHTADATRYAGSMQNEFEVRSKTTANSLILLSNRVNRAAVTLGSVLLPAVNSLLVPVGGVIDGVATLSENFPLLTTVLMSAAVTLAVIPVAAIGVRYGLNLMSSGMAATQLVFNGAAGVFTLVRNRLLTMVVAQKTVAVGTWALTAAQTALAAATTAAVWPFVIVGGAAVVAAGLIWKFWKPISAFFKGLFKGIVAGMAPIKAAVAPLFSWLSPVVGALKSVVDWVGNAFSSLAGALKPVVDWVSGLFSSLFSQAEAGNSEAFGEKIGGLFVSGFKFAFMNFTPVGWIIQAFSAGKKALATIDLSASGKAIIDTIITGIKARGDALKDAVKGQLAKVRKLLPFSDAKEGPLSDLTKSGRAMLSTVATGVRQESGPFKTVFNDVLKNVSKGFTAILDPFEMDRKVASFFSGQGSTAPRPGSMEDGHQQIIINQTINPGTLGADELNATLTRSNEKLVELIRQVIRESSIDNRRSSLGGVSIV